MDLKKVVLSRANTFEEIDILKQELNKLPPDYKPFPNLAVDAGIGAILFGEGILLSPMVGKNQFYTGSINYPDESKKGESLFQEKTEGVSIGAKFNYMGRRFVLYRTEDKHRNP